MALDCHEVKWRSQQSHILEGIRNLVGHGQDSSVLTDCTLACDGEYIQAHKLVLSLCSTFFRDLFQKNRADKANTIVILGNVNVRNVRYLLRYMYEGKVEIPSNYVDSFLQAGNMLKVEGLVQTVEVTQQIKPVTPKAQQSNNNSRFVGPASKKITVNIQPSSPTTAKRKLPENLSSNNDTDEEEADSDDGNERLNSRNRARLNLKVEQVDLEMSDDDNPMDDMHHDYDSGEDSGNDAYTRRRSVSSSRPKRARGKTGPGPRGGRVKRPDGPKRIEPYLLKPRRHTSICWRFFVKQPDQVSAKCTLCDVIFKTKQGSTTALLNHLERVHNDILTEVPPPQIHKRNDSEIPTGGSQSQPSSSAYVGAGATSSNASSISQHPPTLTLVGHLPEHDSSNSVTSEVHEVLQSSYNVLNDSNAT